MACHNHIWLVVDLPILKNDGIRQWKRLIIPYMKWKIKFMFQTTNQYIYIYGGESMCLVGFRVDIYIWLVGKNGDKKWEFLGSFMGFTGRYHNMVSMV